MVLYELSDVPRAAEFGSGDDGQQGQLDDLKAEGYSESLRIPASHQLCPTIIFSILSFNFSGIIQHPTALSSILRKQQSLLSLPDISTTQTLRKVRSESSGAHWSSFSTAMISLCPFAVDCMEGMKETNNQNKVVAKI